MKKWRKSDKLGNVHYDVRGIVLEKAQKLEREGIRILKLNIGNTTPFSLFTADRSLSYMSEHLFESQGYENSQGMLQARETIVKYYKNKNILIDAHNIYIGNGVSELIGIALHALLNPEDEILIPSPDYPLWTATVHMTGSHVVHYRCEESNDWNPDLQDIKQKITKSTKAIVIINPNNPTGAVYTKEILQEIVSLAISHNLIIFADEIYERVIYDNTQMHYIAQLTGDYPCIFFNGLSKAYRAPGFRVGWMAIHDPLDMLKDYREGLQVLSNMRLCSNVPSQWALIAALSHDNEIDTLVSPGGRLYQQREIVMNALEEIEGVSVVRPKGSMYVFPKLDEKTFHIANDEKLVLDLLESKHILIVHGHAFNYHDHNHIRIVFLPEPKELTEAMEKMKDFLKSYRQ